MKSISTILVLHLVVVAGMAQRPIGTLAASVSGNDRIALVKSSIDVPAWHEKSFWPLYENYLNDIGKISTSSYRTLQALTTLDDAARAADALHYATELFNYRANEISILKKHYSEIGRELNGIIALQFLQTEALLDMVQNSEIYDQSYWKKYRFHSNVVNEKQAQAAKHAVITAALELSEKNAPQFWNVYNRYEIECEALLGSDYSLISLYAGEASDFTPALAKRLGYDFLQVMERELRLKEKYFNEMNQAVGAPLAARFLAWEDYYSLVSKMYTWAEN